MVVTCGEKNKASFIFECVLDFGSVGRKEKKIKKKKNGGKSMELGGSVPQHNIREACKRNKKWRCIFVAAKPSELQMQQHSEIIDTLRYVQVWCATDTRQSSFKRRLRPESFSRGRERKRKVPSVVKVKSEKLCG